MKLLTAIFAVVILIVLGGVTATATADHTSPSATTYQGKSATWWAKRAIQNRKNSNARGMTIQRLKKSVAQSPTIQECIKLATIAYPVFTERRAWQIIKHESWMTRDPVHAVNTTPVWNGEHAAGLYQMLPSTFGSTPYGKSGMSIWSPCAQSLAAGWMHTVGRGREWQIGTGISGN